MSKQKLQLLLCRDEDEIWDYMLLIIANEESFPENIALVQHKVWNVE